MTHGQLRYWLALKRVEGIGNIAFKSLVEALGSPEAVFHASINTLTSIPGIGKTSAARIKSFKDWQAIDEELSWIDKRKISMITFQDDLYPDALLHIYDFPPILYVNGTLQRDDIRVAVVGSRLASPYGKYSTEKLCRELAFHGVTVVSGMARGIDSAAHRGAIAAKGITIAVLGCGLDIIYPPENEKLYHDIAAHGAVISEFPCGTPPNAPNFPARNRIISGISLGVVVVEATDKSGSLITARIAGEQGREVYAVPGSIDAVGSKGTNKLIKEGAKLVETVYDILEELSPLIKTPLRNAETPLGGNRRLESVLPRQDHAGPDLDDDEAVIWNSLAAEPVDVNGIIQSTGWTAGHVLNILMRLELRDMVTQLPGKMFQRKT